MKRTFSRRDFTKALGLGTGVGLERSVRAAGRRLQIGHTGITWGFKPEDAAQAIPDVARLGYHGYESFGNVLEAWEAKGGLGQVLEAHKLQLISA